VFDSDFSHRIDMEGESMRKKYKNDPLFLVFLVYSWGGKRTIIEPFGRGSAKVFNI
jgi:hypothetical protein